MLQSRHRRHSHTRFAIVRNLRVDLEAKLAVSSPLLANLVMLSRHSSLLLSTTPDLLLYFFYFNFLITFIFLVSTLPTTPCPSTLVQRLRWALSLQTTPVRAIQSHPRLPVRPRTKEIDRRSTRLLNAVQTSPCHSGELGPRLLKASESFQSSWSPMQNPLIFLDLPA